MLKKHGHSQDEIDKMTIEELIMFIDIAHETQKNNFIESANASRLAQADAQDYKNVMDKLK